MGIGDWRSVVHRLARLQRAPFAARMGTRLCTGGPPHLCGLTHAANAGSSKDTTTLSLHRDTGHGRPQAGMAGQARCAHHRHRHCLPSITLASHQRVVQHHQHHDRYAQRIHEQHQLVVHALKHGQLSPQRHSHRHHTNHARSCSAGFSKQVAPHEAATTSPNARTRATLASDSRYPREQTGDTKQKRKPSRQ